MKIFMHFLRFQASWHLFSSPLNVVKHYVIAKARQQQSMCLHAVWFQARFLTDWRLQGVGVGLCERVIGDWNGLASWMCNWRLEGLLVHELKAGDWKGLGVHEIIVWHEAVGGSWMHSWRLEGVGGSWMHDRRLVGVGGSWKCCSTFMPFVTWTMTEPVNTFKAFCQTNWTETRVRH